MILIFFIKHMHINVLGKLVTTKQLTLYFLRKSAKIIYNGLFPSFFFFCFWENGFRKECTSSAVGKQSSERNLAPSTGNWVVLAFHIHCSFNPIKVIVMLLEQFQQKSDFWVACVRQQYLTIFIWLLTIQSSVNTKSDCLYMKKVYNILTRADGINMLQQVGGNKWNVDNNTII